MKKNKMVPIICIVLAVILLIMSAVLVVDKIDEKNKIESSNQYIDGMTLSLFGMYQKTDTIYGIRELLWRTNSIDLALNQHKNFRLDNFSKFDYNEKLFSEYVNLIRLICYELLLNFESKGEVYQDIQKIFAENVALTKSVTERNYHELKNISFELVTVLKTEDGQKLLDSMRNMAKGWL